MAHRIDLTGMRFGMLVAVSPLSVWNGRPGSKRVVFWKCDCDCGRKVKVRSGNLRAGKARSCGCSTTRFASDSIKKHGKYLSSEYKSWCSMKQRCHNPNNPKYHRYGGRGITVCEGWLNDFSQFLSDMGPRPKGTTLERVDNSGGYHPSNCVWADRLTQQNNISTNKIVTAFGESDTLSNWSRRIGIPKDCLRTRLRRGWPVESALTRPVEIKNKREPGRDDEVCNE